MASEYGAHLAAFTTEYEAIIRRARQVVDGFPPLLRGLAAPFLPQWCSETFSRIVALLPYWVADLLDGLESPERLPAAFQGEDTETLGLANLLGWWSYLIQDWLLDRELARPELLPLSMALHAAAVRLFERLLPGDEAFWTAFENLSLATAEAHCWEQRFHFRTLADVDKDVLDFEDLDRLADRSALLRLTTVAQLTLRGYEQGHPLYVALIEMLRHYSIGRQIGDDLTDWVDDLKAGRLNYVSARIMLEMKEMGAIQDYDELDVERMVGYFLCNDGLFADIQRVTLAACQQAARCIAPFDSLYLGIFVEGLVDRTERSHEIALESRHKLQTMFLHPR